jgi:hypothetical protein
MTFYYFYFSVFVSGTCNKPRNWFIQYTDRYYINTESYHLYYTFNSANSKCIGDGSRLAIISDKNSHNAVYTNRGKQMQPKI